MQGRPRVRIPALKGEPIANFSQRFRSQRPVHVSVTRFFLEGAAGSVRPSKGVSSTVAHFGFRTVQFSCFALTKSSVLAMRGCSEGGSSEDSATARWRWAWRVTTRQRARSPLMLTSSGTNEVWGAPLGVQNLIAVRV